MKALAAFTLHCLLLASLHAQDFDHSTAPSPQIAQRQQANAALEAHNFSRALKLLSALAAANPKDAQITYDLASAQDALDQTSAAEQNYRAAYTLAPAMTEARVALGLLLARNGKLADARVELLAASELADAPAPLKARAFRTLARIDQQTRPADARDELLAALKLTPETPEDTLLSAELAASATNGFPAAEAAYRRVLAQRPNDPEATAALAHMLAQHNQVAEAESLLGSALIFHPADPVLSAELAAVLLADNKAAEALPLVQALHTATPADANVTRLLSEIYLQTNDFAQAEPLLTELLTQSPQDATLMADLAHVLIRQKRFPEAQKLLTQAASQPQQFKKPADLADVYTDLAFAAHENNDSPTVLRAVSLRASVSTPSATVLFLNAIAHDKLHHTRQAQQSYKDFISASNGANPDQEFEAKHRLSALEHMK